MASRRQEYETAIIISGNDKGGIKILEATGDQVDELSKKQKQGGNSASDYGKKHKDAGDDVGSFSDKVKRGIDIALKAAAATAAAITGLVTVNTKVVAEQTRTAQMLGISTQSFQAQAHMAKMAGLDVSEYGDVLRDVTIRVREFASIGTGEAADFFEALNLDIAEFKDLAPDELVAAIGRELEGLNRNDRLLFLDQLGSDQATMLVDVISKLDQMEQEAIAIGVALSDVDAEQINQAAVGLEKAQSVATGAANQITAALAPVVSDLTTRFYDAAVGAGGVQQAVDLFVEGALTGVGFVADSILGLRRLLKFIEVGWLEIGAMGTDALASNTEGVSKLINLALVPLQAMLGSISEGWAVILYGFSQVPGMPFADSLLSASDTLRDFSRDIRAFEVDATMLIQLNERSHEKLVSAREALNALLSEEPPSDRLVEWYEEVRRRAEEMAQATLDANAAQGASAGVTSQQATAIEQLIDQMEFENSLLGMTSLEQKIQNNLRKAGAEATDEQREAIRKLTTERHLEEEATAAAKEALKGLTTEADVQRNFVENLQREWAGLIRTFVTGTADVGDFFDTIIKGIAEIRFQQLAGGLVNMTGIANIPLGGGTGKSTPSTASLLSGGAGSLFSGLFSGGAGSSLPAAGAGAEAWASFYGAGSSSSSAGFLSNLGGFATSHLGIALMAGLAGKLIHDKTNDPDGYHRGMAGFLSAPTPGAPASSTFSVEAFASGFNPIGIADGPVSRQDAINLIEQYRFLDQTYVDSVLAAGGSVSPVGTLGGFDVDGTGSGTFFGETQRTTPEQSNAQQLFYLKQLVAHTVGLAPEVVAQLMGSGSAQEMVDILATVSVSNSDLTTQIEDLVGSNDFVVDSQGNLIDSNGKLVATMGQLVDVQNQLPQRIQEALMASYASARSTPQPAAAQPAAIAGLVDDRDPGLVFGEIGDPDTHFVDGVQINPLSFAESQRRERVQRNIDRVADGYSFVTGAWETSAPVVIPPPALRQEFSPVSSSNRTASKNAELLEVKSTLDQLIYVTEQSLISSNQSSRALDEAVRRGGGSLAVKVIES